VLFITAYPEDEELAHLKEPQIAFLAKPIRDYADILKKVKDLLEKSIKK
jgi:hypothetical protein